MRGLTKNYGHDKKGEENTQIQVHSVKTTNQRIKRLGYQKSGLLAKHKHCVALISRNVIAFVKVIID